MATGDLIDIPRAVMNASLSALNTSNPLYLAALISTASAAIQGECARKFVLANYVEYYDGGNYPYDVLQLRNFPVTVVTRLSINPIPVITIANSDPTTNQYADVSTTDDGTGNCLAVVLSRTASGATTSSTLTSAANVTFSALATAINALGNGWTATVASSSPSYANYGTATLKPLQGAMSAFQSGAELIAYTNQSAYGGTGTFWGESSIDGSGISRGWRLDAPKGIVWGCLPACKQGIRIDYTAGFAVIPQDIQQACLRVCNLIYENDRRDSAVMSERIGPYTQEFVKDPKGVMRDGTVQALIGRYKDWSKLASD